jgi:endogenous inhibitor of DNA gyrase (YacG/DUF329 family)
MATEDSTRCARCGKAFSRANRMGRRPRYCSTRCRWAWPRRCAECGIEFVAPRARFRFCSRRCGAQASVRARRARFWPQFWKRVAKSDDGCWLWTGVRGNDGYGQASINGAMDRAHRVVWAATHGPIPAGLQVCHHCDQPLCVRPEHLFLGTAGDNYVDSRAKDRNSRGSRNGHAKLTEAQVAAMRAGPRRRGNPQRWAQRYGLSVRHMKRILSGRAWRHV